MRPSRPFLVLYSPIIDTGSWEKRAGGGDIHKKSLNIRKYSSIFNMGIGADFKYTKKHVCNSDPNVNIPYAKKHVSSVKQSSPKCKY
jgi:hypothetical protein